MSLRLDYFLDIQINNDCTVFNGNLEPEVFKKIFASTVAH